MALHFLALSRITKQMGKISVLQIKCFSVWLRIVNASFLKVFLSTPEVLWHASKEKS